MKILGKDVKPNTEKILNRAIIIASAAIGCLSGFVCILISKYFQELHDVINNLGSLLISISSGSLLLELFGYVNYTRKRMCEVLCEDDVLEVLTTHRKKELKTALLNNLYMPNKKLGENNIVQVIDNEMDNILKDFYYKEYIMYVDICIVEINGKKYIKKEIKKTYTAETINNQDCSIKNLLEIQITPVDIDVETVKLNYLYINNELIPEAKLLDKSNIDEIENHYDKLYFVDMDTVKDKLKFNTSVSIDIKYTTMTEITDKVFSHQIEKPCKHYCIHFNYDSNIELDIVGFGFMTAGSKNKKRVVKTQHGHMLRFLTWILPGDGVMAVISTKNNC